MKKKILISITFLMMFVNLSYTVQSKESNRPKVGLVLSGGGAKGLAHIGVLKVLDEIGLEVDMVSGTSMGSIVGGLYAIGYDAAFIEKLIIETNWIELFRDELKREYLSIDEKNQEGRYVLGFPIRKGRIQLPAGLIAGQNISMMLSRLTLPVYSIQDFNQFTRPFFCVATDVETGEAIILDKGNLAEAMRASMAIPTVFTPMLVDGRMLVDGGVVQNFPVQELRKRGADIIIGVNVGTAQYAKEEMDSLVKILEQSLSLWSLLSTEEQKKYCDVLIEPNTHAFNTAGFDQAQALIDSGEEAARKILEKLVAVKAQSRQSGITSQVKHDTPLVYQMDGLELEGLSHVSKHIVLRKLRLDLPGKISIAELEESIARIKGSGYFQKVTYQLRQQGKHAVLVIKLKEKDMDLFQVGLAYHDEFKAALLLNNTFLNLIGQGSKTTIDLQLSENPRLQGRYTIHSGWQPGLGLGGSIDFQKVNAFTYDNTGRVNGNYNFFDYNSSFFIQTNFSNAFVTGVGIAEEFTRIEALTSTDLGPQEVEFLNYFGYIKIDTLDQKFFPSSGLELKGVFTWHTDHFINLIRNEDHPNMIRATLNARWAKPLFWEPFSWHTRFYATSAYGEEMPEAYHYFIGAKVIKEEREFSAVHLIYQNPSGKNLFFAQTGFQIEWFPHVFTKIQGAVGKSGEQLEGITKANGWSYGIGLLLGIRSPLGPIEARLSQNNAENTPRFHFHLGHRF